MEPERWKQIEDLFEAARWLSADQRAEFLRKACGGDHALEAEVDSLLKAAEADDSFLDGAALSSIAERPPTFKPGDTLGNFQILSLLGRGGMGEVWRARDPRLKRDVAIKVLPSAMARDPARIARFEREARAASALNHPNIVSVYDVGHEKDTYWIATELVNGETLRRLIESGGPLRPPKAVEIAAQVAAGLAAAHAAGLVHRDLKPDNLMVTPTGQVKILDFGLAKQSRPAPGSSTAEMTDEGIILGTVGYMSPEQVRSEQADHRSDLFSFGVVLYEMLSGKRAFAGGSSAEVMSSILKEDPRELPASVPPPLARIVSRCMEKSPDRRFQSAADLGFALLQTSTPPSEQPKVRPPWHWAALLATPVIAGAIYWIGMRPASPPAPPETTFRRLTNDPGLTTSAAISPDGKLFAYSSVRADPSHLDIWVQQVDGGGLVRITDGATDHSNPAFSPDGTQIAFRSERGEGGIHLAPAIGGEARLIVPQGKRPRFSADGRMLMYWTGPQTTDVRGSSDQKIWVRRLASGEATHIGAGCRLFPQTSVWSLDGSRILFIGTCGTDIAAVGSRPENYGLSAWVATPDGKELNPNRELYRLWSSIFDTGMVIDEWVANPSRLLIPLSVGDAASITAVPVSSDGTRISGPPQRLAFSGGHVSRVSAALNGRIVLSTGTSEPHIWLYRLTAAARWRGPQRK